MSSGRDNFYSSALSHSPDSSAFPTIPRRCSSLTQAAASSRASRTNPAFGEIVRCKGGEPHRLVVFHEEGHFHAVHVHDIPHVAVAGGSGPTIDVRPKQRLQEAEATPDPRQHIGQAEGVPERSAFRRTPENYFEVRKALEEASRTDVIGGSCDTHIPAHPPKEALRARHELANRAMRGDHVYTVANPDKGYRPMRKTASRQIVSETRRRT